MGNFEESPYFSSIQARETVNQALTEYCDAQQVSLVDLFTATCDPQTRELDSQYSEDGLHLTTLGYRTLADLLWYQVFGPSLENQGK